MKLSALYSLASLLVAANAIQVWKAPTVEDAAINARTLIQRESLANINTVYQDGEDKGLPASFVEYYADCGDGNPVILAINMSTSFKNVENGSQYSLTVRVGDHAPSDHVNPKYPGSRPHSVAGSPRINLRGKFENVKDEEFEALQKCFLDRHEDAAMWLPGNPIHESHFVKFMVDEAYFLGGFGDTGYIGKISKDLYSNAAILEDEPHHEEHRGPKPEGHRGSKPEEHEGKGPKLQHSIEESVRSFYKKIDDEIALLKSYLNEEGEVVNEHPVAKDTADIFEAVKSKFGKRDEQTPIKAHTDLTKEEIKSLLSQLETLRSDVHKYGEDLIKKFGFKKQEFRGKKDKHGGAQFFKGLAPGDHKSEDIFAKNHPGVDHVPEFFQGKIVRVVEDNEQKPGVYTGEEYYEITGKSVEGELPSKVYVKDHDENVNKVEDHRGPKPKHHKDPRPHGKKPEQHGGKPGPAHFLKGLAPGDHTSEEIWFKNHPDLDFVPEKYSGKITRVVVEDETTKPGFYKGQEFYEVSGKSYEGKIPDSVFVIDRETADGLTNDEDHERSRPKHHKGPKPQGHKPEHHGRPGPEHFYKGLAPGDHTSEEIWHKNHPDVDHVPKQFQGMVIRVVEADEAAKPGLYKGEEFYEITGKSVEGELPTKVFVIENEARVQDDKFERKHHGKKFGAKGKGYSKHGGAKIFKDLTPGDHRSDDIFAKNHPGVDHVPEKFSGKNVRVVINEDVKPGVYTGEEYYKLTREEYTGELPDKVYVKEHEEHERPPIHGEPRPSLFSGLFHILEFLKGGPEPPMEGEAPEFHERRPKGVKFHGRKHDM